MRKTGVTMKIKDLFQKDIHRKIEEVIKVDQADQETVKNELEEYIVTDSIKDNYLQVLEAYNAARTSLTEGIGVWVSGFFGSGKSSFAKNLGYILANREVLGEKASDLFSAQVNDKKITDRLKVINTSIPTHAVIFDVSMDRGIRTASERITEVMYKALLRELDYSEDFDLADLERGLESDGLLEEFENLFEKEFKKPWRKRRKIGRSLNEASAILHKMDPKIYSQADSWVRSLGVKDENGDFKGRADISANRLAELSFELMARRQPGKALIFIIDEVGQYVSRSVDKMLDLQAIIQAFGREGKNRVKAKQAIAPTWIVVTSQEKLNEVVDALDSKKIELARLQDRFPVPVDLAPTDIAEVARRRVLQKRPEARKLLADLYQNNQGRLASYTKLERTSRAISLSEDEFIDIYPYLPYQIDLCIDIMSGIRSQPGAQRHIGGSNRTIIKQAQEMLISNKVKLGDEEVGALVTLDKVYDLVDGNLSSEKRKDISDISKTFAGKPFYARVAKAICLLDVVRDLPRTPENIAAVLYDRIDGDSCLKEVQQALNDLEKAQFARQVADGYKLQTAQEKDWETTRRGMTAKPADRNRIKKNVLKEIFSDHRMSTYRYKNLRNFRVGVAVDGDKLGDEGDIQVSISVADDADAFKEEAKEAREISRGDDGKNRIFWVIMFSEEIHRNIEELYRSQEMVASGERQAAQGKLTLEETSCLTDEKTRRDRIARNLKGKITNALQSGVAYFQGIEKDISSLGKDLSGMTKGLFDFAVPDLYPKLEMGARKLTGKEAEQILTAANLRGLPAVFYEGDAGLNLVIKEGAKFVPNLSAEIAREITDYLNKMHSYGEKVTGKGLESHFGGIGYGWERDILRLVLAVLLRAGEIEVTYQGQKYSDHNNPNCRQPFINNTAFRAASFVPYITDVTLKVLTDAEKNYETITGEEINVEKGTIAVAFKQIAALDLEQLLPVKATVDALSLPCSEFLSEQREWLQAVSASGVDDCVKVLASEGKTFVEVRKRVKKIADAVAEPSISGLKKAMLTLDQKYTAIKSFADITEEIDIAAAQLSEALKAADFYDRISDIVKCEKVISRFYEKAYREQHKRRFELVNGAMEFIKGHPEWGNLPEDSSTSILAPLTIRACENAHMKSDSVVCADCQSLLSKIESDIVIVETLRKNAFHKIEELIRPEVKIERIKISRYLTSSIETEDELNDLLEEIKKVALKYLTEGKKVLFE